MNATRTERPYPMGAKDLARFMAKHDESDNGCWVWTAAKNHKGYGSFFHGKSVPAHRASYKHFVGEGPKGLEIDHLCRVRSCVNPEHLEAVTHMENIMRSVQATIGNGIITHCPSGHEYTPENLRTYNREKGYQSCVACYKAHRRSYQKRKAECQTCGAVVLRNNLSKHQRRMHGK